MNKEELLKMNKEELLKYSGSIERISKNSNCWGCANSAGLQFAICNVVLTEKEYFKKIKELNN